MLYDDKKSATEMAPIKSVAALVGFSAFMADICVLFIGNTPYVR